MTFTCEVANLTRIPWRYTGCAKTNFIRQESFIEPELWEIEVYIAGRHFGRFRLLWPWPWPDDLHIRTWPAFPTSRLSKVIVWKTDRQTDIHTYLQTDRQSKSTEIINHAASRVVNKWVNFSHTEISNFLLFSGKSICFWSFTVIFRKRCFNIATMANDFSLLFSWKIG